MDTGKLKKFAQQARRNLIDQITARLKMILAADSPARREHPQAVEKLTSALTQLGEQQLIERVAYTWFNRFCGLRFMDVNRYTPVGVVSPAEGQTQPEILMDAKLGHIDEELFKDTASKATKQQVLDLLSGKIPSRDAQGEAYRLLLVAACNHWHRAMPFLFQRIDDYTELLMPEDLLSENSILAHTREAMTPDACQDVEVIGWLYQFYISEKKQQVFDGLKKNKKITPNNIPAATQLFTPHWIVRYLVENSLGRLWLLNRPSSRLVEQMDYYIAPEQPETDFLKINKPEEIKICDPACGSGHMLTYAFDLLYAIYEEEGYEPAEIPEKILTHNLYGIEIDERAGELAAFALTMKARAKQRRFFNKGVRPNVCVLENVHFEVNELKEYMDFVGRDLFTTPLQSTLHQFEEADNFGSLIRPDVTDVDGMLKILESKNVSGQLFINMTHQKVLQALRQADYLSPKYHVVIANPPYAGSKGLNERISAFLNDSYPDSKFDLMTAFMERVLELLKPNGVYGMINFPSWMFLSSFESLRLKLLQSSTILALAHLGRGMFGSDFGTVAFLVKKTDCSEEYFGSYRRLFEKHVDVRRPEAIEGLYRDRSYGNYPVNQLEFLKIPGSPIAYWISSRLRGVFAHAKLFEEVAQPRKGVTTSNNERFLRFWYEVRSYDFSGVFDGEKSENKRWFPLNKGGVFRRWYGNREVVILWEDDGKAIKSFDRSVVRNSSFYFREGMTWNDITSGTFAMRYSPADSMFEGKGPMAFAPTSEAVFGYIAFFNTKVCRSLLSFLAPTINFNIGDVARVPIIPEIQQRHQAREFGRKCIQMAKSDWDAYEASWDFTSLPLLGTEYRRPTLKATYQKLRTHWLEMTLEMQRLEGENNRILIDAYGLQDELTPEVPMNEITLTCNPHYRYGNDKSAGELEALLLADTVRELVSYAVGCMFGRYALDKPGLILGNQGETIEDYLKRVPEPSFPADNDNVIPMLDGDWFTDDIAERFREFLRVAFGDEHYEANLQFVEQGLNIKNRRNYSIRDYFLGEFYNDHVRRYKKRPIYWLFSSPKGSFNALIYMHRYRPDTVSVVLNDYLREYRTKLTAQKNRLEAQSISSSASSAERTKALKDIENLKKTLTELDEYERDVLYPFATQKIAIDLDDGVKVNYPKFGDALKKIPGIEIKEEE